MTRYCGEQLLWQSVVNQAILDGQTLQKRMAHRSPNTEHSIRDAKRTDAELRQADAWIRAGGKHFRNRCALAGYDPDFIREKYLSGKINLDVLSPPKLSRNLREDDE